MKPMDVGRFFYYWELWEEFFTKRQQIDLYKIKIITHLPNASYLNSHLKACDRWKKVDAWTYGKLPVKIPANKLLVVANMDVYVVLDGKFLLLGKGILLKMFV